MPPCEVRARTFDHERPPIFLDAFDAEKIAFLPYTAVMSVSDQNDFNWNVTPSNHGTKFPGTHPAKCLSIGGLTWVSAFASA